MSKAINDDKNLLARKVAAQMYQQDRLAQHFSIRLIEASNGFARLSMRVQPEMLNGFGICHGGVTFALADTAFAYACNSHNHKTVALNCLISYSLAVNEGDELTASAREQILNNRTGTYDVTVTNQDGTIVALYRGTSYTTKQQVLPE